MLYGKAPPGRGAFYRPQLYERLRIQLVEVYQRVGKSVILDDERAKKNAFYRCEKVVESLNTVRLLSG